MWGMTSATPFGLQWRMFVGERPLFICVALDASRIGSGRQSCLLQFKAAVRVVAIAAFHHSFEHFVMKWLVEVGLDFVMTAHAKLGLAKLQ
jgi:hypothetical protein